MRFLLSILLVFTFIGFAEAQSYEIVDGDTINKVDADGRRQGKWLVKANPKIDLGYAAGEVVETGSYSTSRKTGEWLKTYPGGSPKSKLTYVKGRPKGPYILYYDNGQIEEQGNWARTKNTGDFKRYHPNGETSQEFTFSPTGKRTGTQKYYYDNGQLRLEGTWTEGQESGEMREYYETGDLMEVKQFANGVMDKSSVESYAPKTPIPDLLQAIVDEGEDINASVEKQEKPNQGIFDGDGYKKLFNANKQIAKDGTFKRYRLMEGKQYKYDSNGLLVQIMIFKEGKYIGDGVIEQP